MCFRSIKTSIGSVISLCWQYNTFIMWIGITLSICNTKPILCNNNCMCSKKWSCIHILDVVEIIMTCEVCINALNWTKGVYQCTNVFSFVCVVWGGVCVCVCVCQKVSNWAVKITLTLSILNTYPYPDTSNPTWQLDLESTSSLFIILTQNYMIPFLNHPPVPASVTPLLGVTQIERFTLKDH